MIESLVERWLASHPDSNLVKPVRASRALPVYSDMGGDLLLRPDGEILVHDGWEDDEPQIETDSVWRLTAIVVGVEKYPELRPLLPIRDPGTKDCYACGGRGEIHIAGINCSFRCGNCCGLGWGGAVGFTFVADRQRGNTIGQLFGVCESVRPYSRGITPGY